MGEARRPWTEAELVLLADTRLSLREVAERTDRPVSAVKAMACKKGIVRRPGWSEQELEWLHDKSLQLTEVAKRTGRPLGTVYCMASKLGIERPVGRPKGSADTVPSSARLGRGRSSRVDIALLADASLSYDEIAERTGLDREYIRKAAYYRGLATRGQPKGPAAHKWRGGAKARDERTWRGEDWPEFRQARLELDGFMCQDCSFTDFTGSDLHVHHVIPYRLRSVNDLRWLVTLCRTCHGKRPEHDWEEIPEAVLLQLR